MGGGLRRTSLNLGFTIVELLIVIIVIAILATLVITAYNGVQLKARNAKTADAVQAYKKALMAYGVENGAYPMNGTACLGHGYPIIDSGESCQYGSGSGTYRPSATMDNALKPYFDGNLPSPSIIPISDSGNTVTKSGIQFFYNSTATLDGQTQPYWLFYMIDGHGDCPVGPVYIWGSTAFQWQSPPKNYSQSWGSGNQCMMPLPNPSSL